MAKDSISGRVIRRATTVAGIPIARAASTQQTSSASKNFFRVKLLKDLT
jgi:hypothetical protein